MQKFQIKNMGNFNVLALTVIHLLGISTAEPELKLINIIFRHGDRTPTASAVFPTDPHYSSDFYPYGLGSLTCTGKSRSYKLGEFLRKRYKNFLGDVYLPELLYARSSDYDRTKMSLQLVLAALFPPNDVQKWHDTLNWQPIPISYVPAKSDDLLGSVYLQEFQREKKRVEKQKDIQARLNDYRDFMSDLSNLTGKHINDTLGMKRIYETFTAETFMNLSIPDWGHDMFPNGKLFDGILFDYDLVTYDKNITSALGGNLLLKITTDMTESQKNSQKRKTKLFLYSGHEVSIVAILKSLNVYQTHVPDYSSAVIIELLEEYNEYFVKILYYNGVSSNLTQLKMPGCSFLCPFDKYLDNVKDILELTRRDE